MKFLIVNTDYDGFLSWLYSSHPGLAEASYEDQLRARNQSLFSTADFYSSNLRKLGHLAEDCHANNASMQRAWASEHDAKASSNRQWGFRLKKKIIPSFSLIQNRKWLYEILASQIRLSKPDVVVNLAMDSINSSFFRKMKPHIGLLIGQHAATQLPYSDDLSCYDVAISSFPPTVERFRQKGLRAELHRLAFEPTVLSYLQQNEKRFAVTFVGSLFTTVHRSRIMLLEVLCARFPELMVWVPDIEQLPPDSSIRAASMGYAWGRDMYQILRDSKITINHHGDVPPYANNCRLYAATEVGTLLITDCK